MTDVSVQSATIDLPFLRFARTSFLDGKAAPRLRGFREGSFAVPADTIGAAATVFVLPKALERGPVVKSARPVRRPAGNGSLPATGVPEAYAWGVVLVLLGAGVARLLRRTG